MPTRLDWFLKMANTNVCLLQVTIGSGVDEFVHVYESIVRFTSAAAEMNILLRDKALADILHVIEVADGDDRIDV